MRNNVIATFSHDDKEVRFMLRYTFITGIASGMTIGAFLFAIIN